MKNYLNHLIEDMYKAAENLPAKPYLEISEDDECLRGVIEYESIEPKPMQEWFGIEKANFPPAEKLSNAELELMVKEIITLWKAYNFDPVLPKNLPARIAYQTLVNYFDKPVIWVSEGIIGVEFCEYDPQNCPFPSEYCMCKDFENDFNSDDDDFKPGLCIDNSHEIAILDKELSEIAENKLPGAPPVSKIEKYVNQLIGDLNFAVEKRKNQPNIPDNIEIRSANSLIDLIKGPFKTLEELTGISQSVFPDHIDMNGIQTREVLKVLLKLLDVYKLKIYYPKELPFEFKYQTLADEWNWSYVKDLPDSGWDIDFCTGEPQTCPFGEYCNCGDNDFDFSDDEPPETDTENNSEKDIDMPF